MKVLRIFADKLEVVRSLAARWSVQLEVTDPVPVIMNGYDTIEVTLIADQFGEDILVARYDSIVGMEYFVRGYKIESVDRSRCDQCGERQMPAYICYFVRDNDVLKQLSGKCAYDSAIKAEEISRRLLKVEGMICNGEAGFAPGSSVLDVNFVLAVSAAYIRKNGYVSKKNAGTQTPTGDVVRSIIQENGDNLCDLIESMLPCECEPGYWVQKSVEFLATQKPSEFITSCVNAIRSGRSRAFNILVCIPSMMLREEAKQKSKAANSLLEEAKRIKISGVVELVAPGTPYRVAGAKKIVTPVKYSIRDQRLGLFLLSTSSEEMRDVVTGDRVTCSVQVINKYGAATVAKRPTQIEIVKKGEITNKHGQIDWTQFMNNK